jgi:pimeloyl-ACP methyl ester carboxylesterase
VTSAAARTVRTADGVDLAFRDHGGTGRAVLFAHATGFCGALFDPLIAHLPAQYRAITIDLRGHGDSAPPVDLDFDWSGFATDLLTVVDVLGLDRPLVVGHSCGATAAFLAEQRRPGTFAAMYCYEPAIAFREGIDVQSPSGSSSGGQSPSGSSSGKQSPSGSSSGEQSPSGSSSGGQSPNPLAEGARRRRAHFASRDELVDYLQSKPLFARFDPAVLEAYVAHGFAIADDGSLELKCRPEYEARTFENGASHDGVARLGTVACPVTLVYGDAPDSFPPPMAEAVATRLPQVERHTATGLGHLGPFEDPASIATDIARAFA